MTENKYSFTVSVLLKARGSYWVAQGLEYNIAAQGKTIQEAQREFGRVFVGQVLADLKVGNQPLQHTGPAPSEIRREFQHGALLSAGPTPFPIPDFPGLPGFLPFIRAKAEEFRVS